MQIVAVINKETNEIVEIAQANVKSTAVNGVAKTVLDGRDATPQEISNWLNASHPIKTYAPVKREPKAKASSEASTQG